MSSKNALRKPRTRRDLFRTWSLARRLTLLYAGSSFLMLLLAAAYLYWSLVDNLELEDSAFLANEIQECRSLLHERPHDEHALAHEIQIEPAANPFIKYYMRLLDNQGRILLETPRMANVLPVASFPVAIATTEIPMRGTFWKSGSGESYLLMSVLAQVDMDGITPRILHVALDVSAEEAQIVGYLRTLLAVVALGTLFSCAAGLFVARKGLRPLKDITKATDRISASQLHERIAANAWPEELASLARSFDQMLDRLFSVSSFFTWTR